MCLQKWAPTPPQKNAQVNWYVFVSLKWWSLGIGWLYCMCSERWSLPSGVMKWICHPIHTNRHLRKIKVGTAITRLTVHFTYGVMFDLVICQLEEYDLYDTKYPNWDQVLPNTLKHKLILWQIQIQYANQTLSGKLHLKNFQGTVSG